MEKQSPIIPEIAPKIRYSVPISLWLVEYNHFWIQFAMWALTDSNRWHSRCKLDALTDWAKRPCFCMGGGRAPWPSEAPPPLQRPRRPISWRGALPPGSVSLTLTLTLTLTYGGATLPLRPHTTSKRSRKPINVGPRSRAAQGDPPRDEANLISWRGPLNFVRVGACGAQGPPAHRVERDLNPRPTAWQAVALTDWAIHPSAPMVLTSWLRNFVGWAEPTGLRPCPGRV